MFKSHPLQAPASDWQIDPLVRPVDPASLSYAAVDWADVPQVDYRRTRFRQLAKTESAKVFDDSIGFVVDRYDSPAPALPPAEPAVARENPMGEPTPDSVAPEAAFSDLHLAEPVDVEHMLEADPEAAQVVPLALDNAEDMTELPAHEAQEAHEPDEALDVQEGHDSQEASDSQEAHIPDAEPVPEPAAPVMDEALIEALKAEAFALGEAQGLEAGRAQALAEAEINLGQALEQAAADAQSALEQALAGQRETLEARIQPELDMLREITSRLEALSENPRQFFEPLKRLSLHLAEQLLLGELTLSGAAIERLVQRCLDELDMHGKSMVVVELNPQDKARLSEKSTELLQNIQLQSVSSLAPGSVRVIVNDTQVEDLVGHRLEALAHGLLTQPEQWREQSPFFRQPLAQRDTDVEDATQRLPLKTHPDEEPENG